MTTTEILTILKSDLEIAMTSTSYDNLLNNYIEKSRATMSTAGIVFSDPMTVEEAMLIEMLAAYYFRARKTQTQSAGKVPHYIQVQINSYLLHQKAAET